MLRATTTLALALLVLTTGCSGDGEPAEPTSSPAATAPALPLPPVEVAPVDPILTSGRPAWTSDDLTREQRRFDVDLEVVGDLLLVRGAGSEVVDLVSGRPLWRVQEETEVELGESVGYVGDVDNLALTDTATGPVVVLPYRTDGCAYGCPTGVGQQRGLVGVDPLTGEVVWGNGLTRSTQADYIRPEDRSGRLPVTLEGVSSTTVVAGVGIPGVLDRVVLDRTRPAYVVGIDPATGERVWAVPDLVVEAMAGDLVIGRVNDVGAPDLVGLDARSGAELWRVETTGSTSSVSPRVAVLEEGEETTLLDGRTGEPLAQQLPPGTQDCARWVSGDLDVACLWRDPADPYGEPRLLTMTGGASAVLSQELPDDGGEDWTPQELHDGAITVGTYRVFGDRSGTVDTAGRALLPAEVEGVVLAADDRYLVLGGGADDDGTRRLEILRRRG